MNTSIYDKTAKGREEIATRCYQLAPRLRTLLVMVDGRRAEDELLRNVAGLGLNAASMAELVEQGYIRLTTSYATMSEPEPAPPPAPAPVHAPEAALPHAEAEPPAPSQAEQFRSLYDFYNKTIKANIGLRGFTLQLKVEKAASVDELRALRRPYLEAVLKAKGRVIAAQLAEQLDKLMGIVSNPDSLLQTDDPA
jgi:hypothetical protein